jgi:two-component system response regulator HydG
VLIADPDRERARDIGSEVRDLGYKTLMELTARSALRKIHSRAVNAIALSSELSDIHMDTVLASLRKANLSAGAFIYGKGIRVEDAVRWMKAGAVDIVLDPDNPRSLKEAVERTFSYSARPPATGERREGDGEEAETFLYRSRIMDSIMTKVRRVAPLKTTVLITGESGTGKDLLARRIHSLSGRNGPYFAVNCAAIPETLLEGELFGHEKGAFTGADRLREGRFEAAAGGTLLLDEIGEIPPATQVKLLRAIEEEQVTRLGGNVPVTTDVRILAATNADLKALVDEGTFRQDLYFRLKVVEIDLPPLRSRRQDIPLLAMSFLRELAEKHGLPIPQLTREALEKLIGYGWPGNVRQLRNMIESVLITAGERIDVQDLPPEVAGAASADAGTLRLDLPITAAEAEERLIEKTLELVDGNRTRAAELLGIGRRTLQRKLKA